MSLIIRAAEEADASAWDAFVFALPEATFFHRFGWRQVIQKAYGHQTHFLLAERDGVIEGVLPLAEIKSRLFGHSLIASPFCVYGGIAAATPEARLQLDQRAQDLAAEGYETPGPLPSADLLPASVLSCPLWKIAPLAQAVADQFASGPDAAFAIIQTDLAISVAPYGLLTRRGVFLPPAAQAILGLITQSL